MRKPRKRRDEGEISPIIAEMVQGVHDFCDAIDAGVPVDKAAVVHTVRLKVSAETREYGPSDVRAVRARLRASQPVLADFLGVSVKTVRSWEQGLRPVPKIACRYLDDVQEFPELWSSKVTVEAG